MNGNSCTANDATQWKLVDDKCKTGCCKHARIACSSLNMDVVIALPMLHDRSKSDHHCLKVDRSESDLPVGLSNPGCFRWSGLVIQVVWDESRSQHTICALFMYSL